MTFFGDQNCFILAKDYNLLDVADTFFEKWIIEDDDSVMRIAHIESSTNCLVRYNPTELIPPE